MELKFYIQGKIQIDSKNEISDSRYVTLLNSRSLDISQKIEQNLYRLLPDTTEANVHITFREGSIVAVGSFLIATISAIVDTVAFYDLVQRIATFAFEVGIKDAIADSAIGGTPPTSQSITITITPAGNNTQITNINRSNSNFISILALFMSINITLLIIVLIAILFRVQL